MTCAGVLSLARALFVRITIVRAMGDDQESRQSVDEKTGRQRPDERPAAPERPRGEALEALWPIVYQELRRLAARYLQRERPGHTLQA
ncbi:MAG: ECF-type sigma factor, partial [Vicinamibacteraceae bacterium]